MFADPLEFRVALYLLVGSVRLDATDHAKVIVAQMFQCHGTYAAKVWSLPEHRKRSQALDVI
ncbi:hypothetical protein AB4Y36_24850 [Paraburkholderia sp. BR10936]|uniref:hypothetical protein n=1 Tax=Paraburkholderia sp. BR10936 TaxID=3236993 RepID=UPI0034D16DCC